MDHVIMADVIGIENDLGTGSIAQHIRVRCRPWHSAVLVIIDKERLGNGNFKIWYTPLSDISIQKVAIGYDQIMRFIRNEIPTRHVTHIETEEREHFLNDVFQSVSDNYGIEHIILTREMPLIKCLVK